MKWVLFYAFPAGCLLVRLEVVGFMTYLSKLLLSIIAAQDGLQWFCLVFLLLYTFVFAAPYRIKSIILLAVVMEAVAQRQ